MVLGAQGTAGLASNTLSGTEFTAIAGGFYHSLALTADGSIVSWGSDTKGLFGGAGGGQVSNTPSGTEFTAIAGGEFHSLALRADGSIVSWGNDNAGQVCNLSSVT